MLAKGPTGFRIEAFKFMIYISIPIIASQLFNNPETTQRIVDYYKFIEYPPEDADTTEMKKDLQEMQSKLAQARMRKILMQRQLEGLDESMSQKSSDEGIFHERGGKTEKVTSWWNIRTWFSPKAQ